MEHETRFAADAAYDTLAIYAANAASRVGAGSPGEAIT
jgi:hypothetical protein